MRKRLSNYSLRDFCSLLTRPTSTCCYERHIDIGLSFYKLGLSMVYIRKCVQLSSNERVDVVGVVIGKGLSTAISRRTTSAVGEELGPYNAIGTS